MSCDYDEGAYSRSSTPEVDQRRRRRRRTRKGASDDEYLPSHDDSEVEELDESDETDESEDTDECRVAQPGPAP